MYSITRTAYNSITLSFGTSPSSNIVGYKLMKFNPITGIEELVILPLLEPFSKGEDDYYVANIIPSSPITITVDNDGVYYLYVKDPDVKQHLFVNIQAINNYLFETAKYNICCCPSKPCNTTVFSQEDYIFNVISNMSFSFLGWEFMNINDTINEIPVTLLNQLPEISEIIYRINEYLLTDNIPCQC